MQKFICNIKSIILLHTIGFERTTYLFLLLVVFSGVWTSLIGQTYQMNTNSGQTITTCSGNLYDSGGAAGNYLNNENTTVTFNAGVGKYMIFTFNSFNTEQYNDIVDVYDGANTSALLIGSFSGTTIPPVITSSGQHLTIRFTSNGSVRQAGFNISLSCGSGCSNVTYGGEINGDEYKCGPYTPGTIYNYGYATGGGGGAISYQWQQNTTGTWTDISGATDPHLFPAAITQTTQYRRNAKRSCSSSWISSNIITKGVLSSGTSNITLSNITVGTCINHPLEDVVQVSVQVAWTNPPPNDYLRVKLKNKSEYINVGAGATSPQTITFYTPADGTSNNTITADWLGINTCLATSSTFSLPAQCSNDKINCNILYLCGNDKPWDGDAFDHGIIDYIIANNNGTIVPALTKDNGTGFYYFDPMNPDVPITVNLNNFNLIIVSATTEGWIPTPIINQLITFKGSILNMNYTIQQDLGIGTSESYQFQNYIYYDNTQFIDFYNYDNPGAYYTPVITGGNYISQATGYHWFNSNSVSSRSNGMHYAANAHTIPGFSSTHGRRAHFGIHMNGLWASTYTGYVLPPSTAYFHPAKHLTLQGKVLFDQVLKDASICTPEICTNGIDDDGDGLIDCFDPDCGLTLNREFDEGLTNWDLYNQSGNVSTASINSSYILSGPNSAQISISSSTGTDWHIQFVQPNKNLVAGKTYTLSFSASAFTNRQMTAAVDIGVSPWTTYLWQSINLTAAAQNFSFTFTAPSTISTGRIIFNLGQSTSSVNIDNVQLIEVCCPSITGTTPASRCGTGTVTLGATASSGTINWYNVATGGTSLFTGTSFTTPSISATTTYYVDATSGGCTTSSRTAVTATVNTIPTIIATGSNVCVGSTINLTSSAAGATSYSWSGPNGFTSTNQNPSISNATIAMAGTYTVTVTASGGCTASGSVVVSIISSNAGSDQTQCSNNFTMNANNPGAGNTGTWSVVSGTATVSNVNSPTSNVTLSGASATLRWTVNNSSTVTHINPATDGGFENGTTFAANGWTAVNHGTNNWVIGNASTPPAGTRGAYISNNGGTSHTYTITSSQTSHIYKDVSIPSGNSNITLSLKWENVGESGYDRILIYTAPTTLTPVAGTPASTSTIISGATLVSSTNLHSSSTYQTVTYSLPASLAGTTFRLIIAWQNDVSDGTNPPAGIDEVSLTSTSVSSCVVTDDVLLNVISSPIITGTTPASRCGSGTVTLGATASAGTINWYNVTTGGTSLFTGTSFTTPSISATTTYYVEASDVGCTPSSRTAVTATVNALPTAGISGTNTICSGNSSTFTASGGGSYLWNTGSTTASITVSIAGTYTVTVTNATGCTATATRTLAVNAAPTAAISGTNSICSGNSTTFTASGGGSYLWNTGSTTAAITVSIAGTYTVTVTNATGCTATATRTLTVNAAPTAAISGTNTICEGNSTTFTASGGTSYLWSTTATTPVITVSAAGTYTVTVTNASGCTSTASRILTVNANPTASISGTNTICAGNSSTFTASGGGTYVWSTAATTEAINVSTAATYTVTVTNVAGCTATATRALTLNPTPTIISTTSGSRCGNGPVVLSATASAGTINWYEAATGGTSVGTGTSYTTPSLSSSTTYYVDVTENGCTSSPRIAVNAIVSTTMGLAIDFNGSVCLHDTSRLTGVVNGGISPFTYTWTGPSGFTANTQTINISSSGNYYLTVTDVYNCSATISGFVFLKYEPIVVTLGTNVCEGQPIDLQANGTNVVSYLWSANAGSVTTPTATVYPEFPSSTYTVTITNNLGCKAAPQVVVNTIQKPIVEIIGPKDICVGSTATLSPSSGGSWVSSNPSVATVNASGQVYAVAEGTAQFTFTHSNTGCISLPTDTLFVKSKPTISIIGTSILCGNDSTFLLPSSGGTWTSSNNSIATINNSGRVIGVSPGMARFTFTPVSGCVSDSSSEVTVLEKPTITLTGPTQICVGNQTTLFSATPGYWTVSDITKVSITSTGIITGIQPGTVRFVRTSFSGCSSDSSALITIHSKPSLTINYNGSLCLTDTSVLSLQIANGQLPFSYLWNGPESRTGIDPYLSGLTNGNYYVTVTDGNGCTSTQTAIIYQRFEPIVTNINNVVCEGLPVVLSVTASDAVGYQWSPNAAGSTQQSVSVTPVFPGDTYYVTVTNNRGCKAYLSSQIQATRKPIITFTGPNSVCTGTNSTIAPYTDGSWISTNPIAATINNSGQIQSVSPGQTRFVYTSTNSGCPSDTSELFTVNAMPNPYITGSPNICVGSFTNVYPSTDGLWISTSPTVASVSNAGVVTGFSPGTATLYYTNLISGCAAPYGINITVSNRPVVSINGGSSLCIGSSTTLSPASGGVWVSKNNNIASVTPQGHVTAYAQGLVNFIFTQDGTGCTATTTDLLVVDQTPAISLNGPASICIGNTTSLLPSTGGVWQSLDTTIASIDSFGVITGRSQGATYFKFTDLSSGCVSTVSPLVSVVAYAAVAVTGQTRICSGYTTTLSPSSGGFWSSNNSDIATVTINGSVTGYAPGKVGFYFTESTSGCVTHLPTDAVSVIQCIDPDFGVTLKNSTLSGDLSTNDDGPGLRVYNIPSLISKPPGSTPNFILNANGTYTFSGDKEGKYQYHIPVCIVPEIGCPVSLLEITVIDQYNVDKGFVNNLEFTTTFRSDSGRNTGAVNIKSSSNDLCYNSVICSFNTLQKTIINPRKGSIVDDFFASGVNYIPDGGKIGKDTIYYKLCKTSSILCDSSRTIITINDSTAENSIVAPDDFFIGSLGQSISGNVLLNDTDPENDTIRVVAQGSISNPIQLANGSFYILEDGNFSFVPNAGFKGNIHIPYTVCDNNPSNQECTDATIQLLILDHFRIQARLYLQGALMDNNNNFSVDNRPLMRDDLRVNPFNGNNYIPFNDPYSIPTDFVDITYEYVKVGPGANAQYQTIPNPGPVFSVMGQNAIVDWVFVELRSKSNPNLVIATRSGLLQRDGDVVDLNGVDALAFPGIFLDSFYVHIKHRNHLGVMSLKVSNNELIDFTKKSTPVYNFGTTLIQGFDYTGLSQYTDSDKNVEALWGGDFDSNGKIKYSSPSDDLGILHYEVLTHPSNQDTKSNYNFAYGYYQGDFDLNGKVKFDNPYDDKNLLFTQLIFYTLNQFTRSNFDFFYQQVPSRQ